MNDAIEVEVLEVDGHAPVPPAASVPESDPQRPWQDWQGRVRQLDMRWWPLWVVLGVLALGLLLTLGVVIGAVVLVAKIVGGLIGSVLRLFIGSPSNTSLRR